jgi:hypothetical protein
MNRATFHTTVLLAMLAAALSAYASKTEAPTRPRIQLAILLDTSGSMGGLINQARTHLWSIVNEFATARRGGRTAELQVALFEYSTGKVPDKGWVVPLTTDLDLVSEKLFALRIHGGTEWCGQVIQVAVEQLEWSSDPRDLKVIFIAGNEPFTQGPVDYRKACKAAIEKGIIVNTIHCGSNAAGVSGKWADGAALADGKYLCIDQNRRVVQVTAPQDKQIAQLGLELNKTYVAYGAHGAEGLRRQIAQDTNAQGAGAGSNVSRQAAKASVQYRNASWDLVDAVREKKIDLAKVAEKDLPENMRKMTPEQRKAYLQTQQQTRLKLQKQIRQLNAERRKYVAEQMKKNAEAGKDTLQAAIIRTTRQQAAQKSFNIQ